MSIPFMDFSLAYKDLEEEIDCAIKDALSVILGKLLICLKNSGHFIARLDILLESPLDV